MLSIKLIILLIAHQKDCIFIVGQNCPVLLLYAEYNIILFIVGHNCPVLLLYIEYDIRYTDKRPKGTNLIMRQTY